MLRSFPFWIALACLAGLVVICFGSVLFFNEQFAYRDAAHFYYPLYQVVKQEWHAGRVPLWNPWENSGMPLLGNPTAAVLYPGQLIYAALPYAWGARLYVIAHVLIAALGMYALMRNWNVSQEGSALSALSYAFAAPVLFQYCNIVFLVGAAWAPLGLRAADRLIRVKRRSGLVELAVVLALMTLGGDPQTAYVIGLCAGGYALGLSWTANQRTKNAERPRRWLWIVLAVLAIAAWVAAVLTAGFWLPTLRPPQTQTQPFPVLPWTPHVPKLVLGAWAIVTLGLAVRWSKNREGRALLKTLAFLLGAATLAILLTGAQLLPVLEFSGLTVRAAREGSHEIYAFSLEPYRLAELVWPNVFGLSFGEERSWLYLLPPRGNQKIWVPSLYLGGASLVLALGALGFRNGPPWRAWLSMIAVVSLLASLGTYGSPLWWARLDPSLAAEDRLGPLDPSLPGPIREDGKLRDGDGSPYWLLSTVLPGFDSFRYPSKFLTFSMLALAGLAGLGWDRVVAGSSRRTLAWASGLLVVTVAVGAGLWSKADEFVSTLAGSSRAEYGSGFGPLQPEAAWMETARSLIHGGSALACLIVVIALARRWPKAASALVLILVTLDVGVANRRFILTAPQEFFDQENNPKVLELIEAAEREEPSPGPFRVHRMSVWNPTIWNLESSRDRVEEFVRWERDTIQPKYAIPFGYEYTLTEGTAELFDYWFFFGPFPRIVRDPGTAQSLGIETGSSVIYFPRRSFDMWNTRYFVVPTIARGWNDEQRGYAAFLQNTTPIYPKRDDVEPRSTSEREAQAMEEDFQILRNDDVYPRAWVVHKLRPVAPLTDMSRMSRQKRMIEITYPNDRFWRDPRLQLFNPRELAWIETDDPNLVARFNVGSPIDSEEKVEVVSQDPQRVVLNATLRRPGVVVLADVYYPGWKLTIDGEPAPILRVNHLMRGAAVEAGTHELVYTYEPDSFRIGLWLSGAGVLGLVGLSLWSRFDPRRNSGETVESKG